MAVLTLNQAYFNGANDSGLDTKSGAFLGNLGSMEIKEKILVEFRESEELQIEFNRQLKVAKTGNKMEISQKNITKKKLKLSLEFLILAVNWVAKGNEAILKALGVPITQTGKKQNPTKTEKPQGLTATNTNVSGTVLLDVKTAVGATSFIFQYSADLPTTGSYVEKLSGYHQIFCFGRFASAHYGLF